MRFGHRRSRSSLQRLAPRSYLRTDTSRAPIYPREGLFLPATAIYRRVQNQPHLSFIAADNRITLGRKSYPLVTDKTAAASMLARRARRVAQSGLTNLLHPEMRAKGEIVLSQPYDPNKIPILLVHGLQTTPFTFLQLVNALESDPEIARRFQFWHFYYRYRHTGPAQRAQAARGA